MYISVGSCFGLIRRCAISIRKNSFKTLTETPATGKILEGKQQRSTGFEMNDTISREKLYLSAHTYILQWRGNPILMLMTVKILLGLVGKPGQSARTESLIPQGLM